MYSLTVVATAALALVGYGLLQIPNVQKRWRNATAIKQPAQSQSLKISKIYVYPIKSLLGTSPSEAVVCQQGFKYDRRFMLAQVKADGSLKNMHVGEFAELVLFSTILIYPVEGKPSSGNIHVTHRPPRGPVRELDVPLLPDTAGLATVRIDMHGAATNAHDMGSACSDWFSECLGHKTLLVYLGENRRTVLMTTTYNAPGNVSWRYSFASKLPPSIGSYVAPPKDKITFNDCCPFLVISQKSVDDVSKRLPDGEEMDAYKFRPNIIVEGAEQAWEEDLWGELTLGGIKLHLVHNCARCASINVDFATGKKGTGESGMVLKMMQKDRRIDKGAKYSPIFGRYSFPDHSSAGLTMKVGEAVTVTKRNAAPTIFDWEGLATKGP